MAKAQASGKLHKEQQFVMGIPAREIGPVDSDELVVIQGIIDAYFEEDGELILVDYKTDRIPEQPNPFGSLSETAGLLCQGADPADPKKMSGKNGSIP